MNVRPCPAPSKLESPVSNPQSLGHSLCTQLPRPLSPRLAKTPGLPDCVDDGRLSEICLTPVVFTPPPSNPRQPVSQRGTLATRTETGFANMTVALVCDQLHFPVSSQAGICSGYSNLTPRFQRQLSLAPPGVVLYFSFNQLAYLQPLQPRQVAPQRPHTVFAVLCCLRSTLMRFDCSC